MKIFPSQLNHEDGHKLQASIVLPRPIAFVSTVDENGTYNLAPFSSFAGVCIEPAIVCFSVVWKQDGRRKDTLNNIEFTGDFVINVVNESMAEMMSKAATNYPGNVDEFEEVGLTPLESDMVKSPRVAESPINMECILRQIITLGHKPGGSNLVIGEVVLVHVLDEVWSDSEIKVAELKAIGRLGGNQYCRTADVFEIKRPDL